MDKLVMESTDVMNMSLTDEAKGHIQGLFLITPNQLDDMIGWIHSKYSGTRHDQADSQAPIEASSPQPDNQTVQGTQGPASERRPLDLFSLRHKDTAPNGTRIDQPDGAQPVQQPQPHTTQQASPTVSVQASQASRSAQSDAGQSSGAPKTKRRTGNGDNDGLPPRPFNIWDNIELPDDQTQRDQAPRNTTLLNISAGTAAVRQPPQQPQRTASTVSTGDQQLAQEEPTVEQRGSIRIPELDPGDTHDFGVNFHQLLQGVLPPAEYERWQDIKQVEEFFSRS